jgi:hypothetical protein
LKGNRPTITDNQELILFSEVDGVCPNCPRVLMGDKNQRKIKNYEIAHIYPLNPTAEELVELKDVEKLSSDPNHLDNLICLCIACHNKFDNPRTRSEYNALVAKKKFIIKKSKEKSIWIDSTLENEIDEIILFLTTEEFNFDDQDILNYNPKTIDEKTDSTITELTKRKIHNNVQDYFKQVKNKFVEIEKVQPLTTETISTQIKAHYLKIRKQDPTKTQKEIFDAMVEWLNKQTQQKSKESSEIIISYFIQNCEIFE